MEHNKIMLDMSRLPRSEWEKMIDEWIVGRNAYRDRKILRLKLLDGYTYEKIAEHARMSLRQVLRIVRKRKTELFSHLFKEA